MKTIVRMQFGSHVYGTNVPTSDLDYKGIFIPSAKDLIMQRAAKNVNNNSNKNPNAKNTSDDVDDEMFSLGEFIKLLLQGNTAALEMLFVPDEFILETSPTFERLRKNRDKFLHSGTSAFAGYCLVKVI